MTFIGLRLGQFKRGHLSRFNWVRTEEIIKPERNNSR